MALRRTPPTVPNKSTPVDAKGETMSSVLTAQELFREMIEEFSARVTKRAEAAVSAEARERAGEYVLWFQGVPLPPLAQLANREQFSDWLFGLWTEEERPRICDALPGHIEGLTIRLAKRELNHSRDADALRETRALREYLHDAAKHYPRITWNCESTL